MLLRLVYGQRWSETEAPRALAIYCMYILLLAVNGILEAFVHAVADARCARYYLLGLPCPSAPSWLLCDLKRESFLRAHFIEPCMPCLGVIVLLWHLPAIRSSLLQETEEA